MPQNERAAIAAELSPPFDVREPEVPLVPFVFCSPHSGRVYPSVMIAATRLQLAQLRRSEDCLVDQLFRGVVDDGAPLIAANFARAYIDVNREPYELDPELFGLSLPAFANAHSLRVSGGLGTIARVVADGEEIYHTLPSLESALVRIETLHLPFHRTLSALLERTRRLFGLVFLIDCHSMPSAAMSQAGTARPDFVLGDRFGASCDPRMTRLARDTLVQLGYHTLLNRPYAGGYITEHYGQPSHGVHALQIEINRALYLHEATLEPRPRFQRLQSDLMVLCRRLFRELPGRMPLGAAAE
jgi:N-formylglutamate amidohydrolase